MDEILRQPRHEAVGTIKNTARAGSRLESLRAAVLKAAAAVQQGARVLGKGAWTVGHKLDCALAGRKFINPLPFLAVTGVAAVALVVSTVYTPSYVVTVDGVDLGIVTEPAVYEQIVERVEARASNILGYDYTLDQDVEYTFALSKKDAATPNATFESYLFNHIGDVMKSYVLSVGGKVIGAASTRAELDDLLAEIAAPYTTEYTVSVEYVEDISISYQYISSDVMQDLSTMAEILSANTTGETTYEVVSGDTYSGIAYANDMSLDELMALNPDASLNSLLIGDVLTVKRTVPYLSVRTEDVVSYYEEIPCPVEQVKDNTMYVGTSKVLSEGSAGQAFVTADVTYVNGYEESREILTSETVTEPTTRVVAVGTKERPKTLPTGSFQWPLRGTISSYFGYRTIFGTYSFHSGIDITGSYGAAIAAADGGTVTWAGYKGSYGYLVIVDHGSGVQSYYAHCSSMLVSAGDKVYKGQTIARVGATGRATGNHLHFEVKINGTSVNPLSYLP